jgi:predicted O-methyltransferase YrrM
MSNNDYKFTEDWFSHNIPMLKQVLEEYAGKSGIKMLEIGSFQRRSTVWMLENILTSPSSKITCIDTFEGSAEHSHEQITGLSNAFMHNVRSFGDKVEIKKGSSHDVLRTINSKETYDIIYVDGDHSAPAVMQDAVLAFPLLKKGGLLIFDDYMWTGMPDVLDRPKVAIDAFVSIFQKQLVFVSSGWQFIVRRV